MSQSPSEFHHILTKSPFTLRTFKILSQSPSEFHHILTNEIDKYEHICHVVSISFGVSSYLNMIRDPRKRHRSIRSVSISFGVSSYLNEDYTEKLSYRKLLKSQSPSEFHHILTKIGTPYVYGMKGVSISFGVSSYLNTAGRR